jgi:hypothetical protein
MTFVSTRFRHLIHSLFAIGFGLCLQPAAVHAQDSDSGFRRTKEGGGNFTGEFALTGNPGAFTIQGNLFFGNDLREHYPLLFSLELGMGVGWKKPDSGVQFAIDSSFNVHVPFIPTSFECHSTGLFFSAGMKTLMLTNGEQGWPMYLGPSLGISMIEEVHHNACYSYHTYTGQDIGIWNLSYIELIDVRGESPFHRIGHGVAIKLML